MRHSTTGLAWQVSGPAGAPVIVLGSSLGTTGAMFTPLVEGPGALTERFRVVRYDHLGHGASEVPAGPYTLDGLGRRVAGLLDEISEQLGVRQVVLGGLSLGGMCALWVAANVPQRVQGLVLCCTAAHMPPPDGWFERARTVREQGTASIADLVVQRWFTPGYAAAHPEVPEWARAMVRATPDEGYAGCAEAIALMDLRADLPRISAPTLIIAGDQDPATPEAQARLIEGGIAAGRRAGAAHLQCEIVPDAAHLATVEQALTCGTLIADFATGVFGSGVFGSGVFGSGALRSGGEAGDRPA